MSGFSASTPGLAESASFLLVRTDRLGETVLTLPAIDALRAARPQARIRLMVHPSVRELLDGYPGVNDVVAEPALSGAWWHRAWRLSRLWRTWGLDAIVISNAKKEYHLAAWLAGIPIRVGYDRKWGRLLTHRVPDDRTRGAQHEVEHNVALLRVFGIPQPPSIALQLPVTAASEVAVSQWLGRFGVVETDQLVVVHPWTSNPRKQWPVERFQRVVRRLAELGTVKPVIIGGVEERARMVELDFASDARVIDAVGRLPLDQLAALLRRARVLVTNDSGPMHVAAAVGTPVVALFGTADPGSHPRRWGPWGANHTVIHRELAQISVDEVASALKRYL